MQVLPGHPLTNPRTRTIRLQRQEEHGNQDGQSRQERCNGDVDIRTRQIECDPLFQTPASS